MKNFISDFSVFLSRNSRVLSSHRCFYTLSRRSGLFSGLRAAVWAVPCRTADVRRAGERVLIRARSRARKRASCCTRAAFPVAALCSLHVHTRGRAVSHVGSRVEHACSEFSLRCPARILSLSVRRACPARRCRALSLQRHTACAQYVQVFHSALNAARISLCYFFSLAPQLHSLCCQRIDITFRRLVARIDS